MGPRWECSQGWRLCYRKWRRSSTLECKELSRVDSLFIVEGYRYGIACGLRPTIDVISNNERCGFNDGRERPEVIDIYEVVPD